MAPKVASKDACTWSLPLLVLVPALAVIKDRVTEPFC